MKIAWSDLARFVPGDLGAVLLEGFACPLDREPAAGHFIFAPEPMCCVGCVPRDPLGSIEVFATHRLTLPCGRVRITGRLRMREDDTKGWRFALEDAAIDAASLSGTVFSRRQALGAGALLCLAAAAPVADPNADALRIVADSPTVDIHSHAGGINGVSRVENHAAFTPVSTPMHLGGLAVVCMAAVPDSPVHKVMPDHHIRPFRDPEPGELYAFTQKALGRVHDLVKAQNFVIIDTPAALRAARSGTPGLVVSTEGADFLEGQVDRVDEAVQRWRVRHIQLTHYRVNELGDIQTEPPVHGGLTDFGAAVIERCNKIGVVVDVAHGTLALVQRAAKVTRKPLVLSHTSLSPNPGPTSRLISPAHARLIADTDGVIGIWPPASIFPNLDLMAAGIKRMVDVVGVAHVGLGTDMRGLVGPSVLPDYDRLPGLVTALKGQGFSDADIRAILGGNYLRVFEASLTV
jgi:membrane dipeptidase